MNGGDIRISVLVSESRGFGLPDGKCLPCSGLSGGVVNISPCSSPGKWKKFPKANILHLESTTRSSSFVCSASSSNPRNNPDFSKYSKHGGGFRRQNEDRDGYDNLEESEMFSSENGPLLTASNTSKVQGTATPGPREKKIVELFRKVQAQLRERAAVKEGNKVPEPKAKGKGKESETVDSLLKLLRKHAVQKEKKTDSSTDFILDQSDERSTDSIESKSILKRQQPESEAPVGNRPMSNFRRRSPVSRVKFQPSYSEEDTALQSKQLLLKIQSSGLEISHILCGLLEQSMSSLSLSDTERRIQDFYGMESDELLKCMKGALESLDEGKSPCSEHLLTMIQSLNLISPEEPLNECIALEKERVKAEENRGRDNIEQIERVIELMSHIRDCMVMLNSASIDGVKIPPHFRCPLSLAVMLDPVIIASGQTYERVSIQKWMDHGLTTCPRTRQKLSHSNLIPNVTVKAMIENWCEENKVKLFAKPENASLIIVENSNSSSQDCNSTSRWKANSTHGISAEGFNGCHVREDHSSPEHSYVHSRSESASSVVSSIDYLPVTSTDASKVSSKHDYGSDKSGEITSDSAAPLHKNTAISSLPSGKQYRGPKTLPETAACGNYNHSRRQTSPTESLSNERITASRVEELIRDLTSQSPDLQAAAAAELRFLAKHDMENRVIIGQSGAIEPLISLLHSDAKLTQEHAVTALLNLSISENIKAMIAERGALEPLIHVLRTGNPGAKENAAAAIFSLSLLEEYKIKIGRSGAVKALVDLLGSGTIRGKKDAATALFNLSIFHENKARIVQAGAVKYLVQFLDPETVMVDKSVALLANLSTIPDGCLAIAREGGIPPLVEIVEIGSHRGKENAASILLQLCLNSPKYCRLVLQEGAVPPLVALSQSGSTRAKEKLSKYETLGCTFWYELNEPLILLCPMNYPESTQTPSEFNSQD
nr:U-box domain-containing protein 3 [Ipomoea batatas]